jgi:hypothetical protein
VTTGSSRNRSTTESILWQEDRRVPGQVTRDAAGMGTTIPVASPFLPMHEPVTPATRTTGFSGVWRCRPVSRASTTPRHSRCRSSGPS